MLRTDNNHPPDPSVLRSATKHSSSQRVLTAPQVFSFINDAAAHDTPQAVQFFSLRPYLRGTDKSQGCHRLPFTVLVPFPADSLPSTSLRIFWLLDVHCQLNLAPWMLCLGTIHGQLRKFPQIWMRRCWRTLIHLLNLGFSYVSSHIIPKLCPRQNYFLLGNSRCPRNHSVLRCHPKLFCSLRGRIECLHSSLTGFLRCC
jgi:hypothetical protein